MLEPFVGYDWSEEELLRSAADHPALSAGLRERVIEAVLRARRLDAIRRRVSLAVCVMLLAVTGGMCFTQGDLVSYGTMVLAEAPTSPAGESAADGYRTSGPFTGPAELMVMSQVGDWGHVDAVARFREIRRDNVFRTFTRY